MFFTRLISGIALVVIALFVVIGGGDILFGTLGLISLIGLSELYKVQKVHNDILGAAGYIGAIFYYAVLKVYPEYTLETLLICFILIMAVYVLTFPKYRTEQVTLVFFGICYVAVMLSCVYRTRMLEDGVFLVWLIFLCSWGCDTAAYCVGMLIGKHKLAPRLSPKKSIEGAIGGVVGAALLGGIYAAIAGSYLTDNKNLIIAYGIICAVGAVISQIGDLAASAIKRNYDIKDYGNLIPGHGGILDRFDSIIFTAPVIYLLAKLFL